MAVGQGAGEDTGQRRRLSMVTSSERSGGHRCGGGADELVDRIAVGDHPGGPGVGQTGRAVGLEDGGGGGQARAGTLRAPAPTGEEVGLDEAGHDPGVGLDVAAIEEDRCALDVAHLDVASVVGVVVVDPVAGHDVGPDQRRHLLGRGLPVGAGGAQQLHPVGTGPGPLQLGQQRRQDGGVGHRAG